MEYDDLLEIEYKEQFNQFRWIGQMQAVVLTAFGLFMTLGLAATAMLRIESVSKASVDSSITYAFSLQLFSAVIILLGFLGAFIGVGLFKSRSMQRRTALYFTSILMEMFDRTKNRPGFDTSALRFRAIASTAGKFSLMDTMNVAIVAVLLASEFLIVGGAGLLVYGTTMMNSIDLQFAFTVGIVSLWVATPTLVQKMIFDRDIKQMEERRDWIIANIRTVADMRIELKHLSGADTQSRHPM